ncbi:MAG: LPXTG cell wall anchor domain-containing protein [Clostridiales bacterium]|nr:LPXTG cell wall anchor domain-containing protein [Clostridiales bacterium]
MRRDRDKDNIKDKPVKTGDADMAGATTAACILSGIAAVAIFKKRKTV